MDAYSDTPCEEVRREEPVLVESSEPHVNPLSTLLPKETEKSAPATQLRSLPSVDTNRVGAAKPPSAPDLNPLVSNSVIILRVDPLTERVGAESRTISSDNLGLGLCVSPTSSTRIHELTLHEDQSTATSLNESHLGSPRTMPRFFLNPESPTWSNSSDGSSLFGSPRALSTGARSTSSDYYGCDSASSSREVSPFGSPSGGSYPLFRFAFPNVTR